ncbi:MAG: CDP-alcohol phosphatidyltransferase family protein [Acidobacteriota bacterium]|nr:CDP-alcohol phosphatidyltransferase family protein [Acidobacteriota bacterium]
MRALGALEILALVLIAPPALLFFARFAQYYLLRLFRRRAPKDEEMLRRGESVFLGQSLRQAFAFSMAPIFGILRKANIHPNTLTLVCLLVSCGAAALIARGDLVLGGLYGLLGSSLDYLDGRMARLTGRASKAGGFLDSTLDRYSDIAFLSGAAVLFRDSVPMLVASLLALGSGGVISYTRAKAESLGGTLTVGLMQRPERIVLFCLGALLDPVVDPWLPTSWQGHHALFATAIVILAVLSTWTAVHRTIAGFQDLRKDD